MAGATVQVGGDATTTAVVTTADQVVDTTTTQPVDPWDKKRVALLAEIEAGGDGTEGDGSNAGTEGEGAAGAGEGVEAGEGTKPQGEGAAATKQQRKDRTDTVPIDRFERVVAERNEAIKKANELAGNANYEAGRADALADAVAKTGTPKDTSGIPDDPLEIIEQALLVYDKQFEEGALSATDYRVKLREADDLRRSLIAENDARDRRTKADADAKTLHEQIISDPDLIEADQQLHTDNPWVALIPAKVMNELIIPAARESLGKLAPTAADTIRLHQAIYQEAIDLGLQRKYDKTAKGDPQTTTTAKPSAKPPVVTGDQRAAKADLANKHPPGPGIGAAGAAAEGGDSASTGEINLTSYERMTAEQRKAYMVKMGALPA